MPRKRRQKSKTDCYHIVVKGVNKEKIFNQQREKIYFKSIILKHLSKYQVEIYSYCIMSNHAHFIIRAELNVLSEYMSIILSEYAVYYNFKHSRNGHVFQNRFYSECIESETYYWSCLRYIHLNPVKARIVKKAETYKYSSMYEYSSCCTTILSERALTMVRQHFGEIEEFKQFHQKKAENVFFDLNEEIKMQQEEVALEIAKKIQKEYKMKLLCQVVEEKETRNVYEEQLKDQMGLSKRRIKELCLKLK